MAGDSSRRGFLGGLLAGHFAWRRARGAPPPPMPPVAGAASGLGAPGSHAWEPGRPVLTFITADANGPRLVSCQRVAEPGCTGVPPEPPAHPAGERWGRGWMGA